MHKHIIRGIPFGEITRPLRSIESLALYNYHKKRLLKRLKTDNNTLSAFQDSFVASVQRALRTREPFAIPDRRLYIIYGCTLCNVVVIKVFRCVVYFVTTPLRPHQFNFLFLGFAGRVFHQTKIIIFLRTAHAQSVSVCM